FRFFHDLKQTSRGELHGPCWQCGGTDRFIIFTDNGRGWCRQCGWKGDAIQYLRDRDGLSFTEALRALGLDPSPLSRQQRRRATVHSLALGCAKRAYNDWTRQLMVKLTDRYRLLLDDLEVAVIAYRAIPRHLDLYSATEHRYWPRRLGRL